MHLYTVFCSVRQINVCFSFFFCFISENDFSRTFHERKTIYIFLHVYIHNTQMVCVSTFSKTYLQFSLFLILLPNERMRILALYILYIYNKRICLILFYFYVFNVYTYTYLHMRRFYFRYIHSCKKIISECL